MRLNAVPSPSPAVTGHDLYDVGTNVALPVLSLLVTVFLGVAALRVANAANRLEVRAQQADDRQWRFGLEDDFTGWVASRVAYRNLPTGNPLSNLLVTRERSLRREFEAHDDLHGQVIMQWHADRADALQNDENESKQELIDETAGYVRQWTRDPRRIEGERVWEESR